jgi:hypothetical protein
MTTAFSGAEGPAATQACDAASALPGKIQTLNCGVIRGSLVWGFADLVISQADFGKKVARHFEAQGFRVDNRLPRADLDHDRALEVSW